jgi:hypothetical protein
LPGPARADSLDAVDGFDHHQLWLACRFLQF